MTAFILASAALVLLTLAFVLRPLWKARPLTGVGVFASLALATGLTYALIGTPNALDPTQRQSPETFADAVGQLEAELKRDPNQIEGWRLLARAYAAENRADDARDAFAKAIRLAPNDADLLADAAEARALATPGRQFDADAVAMLQHALAQQPMHQRARWFLGIAQRQAKRPADAAKTWEPLLTMVDAKTANSLLPQINAARAEAGLSPLPAIAATPGITVEVSLAPALAAQLPANASLFVLARQPNGPPMPVAVEKLAARDFPVEVMLDDGDSPMPTMKLSQLDRVEITARISVSGNAMPQAGDLEATPKPAGRDAGTIELVIDRVRP